MSFLGFLLLLAAMSIPAAVVGLVGWYVFRGIRIEKERKYAPLYAALDAYAQKYGFTARRIPLYGRDATFAIRQFLPRDLPVSGSSVPIIPLYNDREEFYGQFRSMVLLERGAEKLLWLPKYVTTTAEFFGVALYLIPMPQTRHWLTLWQEAPVDLGTDQEFESRQFNDVYAVHSSAPALATEMLSPDFMALLLSQRYTRTYVRLRGTTAIVGQEAPFSEERLQMVQQLANEFYQRFTRGYPSYPEPDAD